MVGRAKITARGTQAPACGAVAAEKSQPRVLKHVPMMPSLLQYCEAVQASLVVVPEQVQAAPVKASPLVLEQAPPDGRTSRQLCDIENNVQHRLQRYAQRHMRLTVSPRVEPRQNDTLHDCQIYVGPHPDSGVM